MRIGIDASGIGGWRGPSQNVRNLTKYLSLRALSHEIYLFVDQNENIDIELPANVKTVVVEKYPLVSWLNVSLPIEARKRKIDVFLFPQANYWLWRYTPTIVYLRSMYFTPWKRNIVEFILAKLKKNRLRYIADKVIAVSNHSAKVIGQECGIKAGEIEVIYNGIDPVFLENREAVKYYDQEYLLFVGGTEKDKNFEGLVKAFKIVTTKYPDINLIVVGDKFGMGKTQEDRLKITSDNGLEDVIIFHGIEKDKTQIASLYRNAKILIFPSLHETFGMVAVEAMACGCPVVASYMPSIPEVCGDAALYFDPYDPADMANKIETVLNNEELRKDLIKKGYKQIEKYRWEDSVNKLLGIIEDVYKAKC